ncbi:MAG: phosphatidate cytidylyltransferase [Candidatus Binatia bacterium]
MLRARLLTAAVAIPLLLALILYPSPWPLTTLVGVVTVLGVGEYATMAFPTQRGQRVLTICLGVAVVAGAAGQTAHWFGAALALAVSTVLVWTLFARADFAQSLNDTGRSLVGLMYVGYLLPHFIFLRAIPHGPWWVIFVLVIGMAGDTTGYAVGRAFGRHKLMPRVSPGKTTEGAVGILVASLVGAAACKLLFLRELGWGELTGLALVMAALGQLGDLSESVMKRTFGAKESGWLFPGHGGVLDRVDSLLFPVTFLYYYILLFR